MANQEHIDQIFENVMTALQPAEELGGPLDALYVSLMERVAHETLRRAERVRIEKRGMDAHNIVARVTNDKGRAFNVRLVRKGDRYGLDDKLVHDKDEPVIEWWDATHENDRRFTIGRGQFVARYSLSTLTGQDRYSRCDHRKGSPGIDLLGHEPAWKVTGQNVVDALAAVERVLGGAR
jgi:hypothetical protein